MVMDESGTAYFRDALVALYLSAVGRALRASAGGMRPDTALATIQGFLDLEINHARPSADDAEQLHALHRFLVDLVRRMPPEDDL